MTKAVVLAAAALLVATPSIAAPRAWTVSVYPSSATSCTGPAASAVPFHRMDLLAGEQIDWTRPVNSDPSDRAGIVVRVVTERLGGENVVVGDIRAIAPGTRRTALGVPPLVSPILSDTVVQAVCMRDPASHGHWIQVEFRPD